MTKKKKVEIATVLAGIYFVENLLGLPEIILINKNALHLVK